MLFMVIEQFRDSDAVYKRFAERGRMLPAGVTYVDSWVEPDRERCFQLMTAESMTALQEWAKNWNDLVDFQFIEVIPSRQAAAEAGAGQIEG